MLIRSRVAQTHSEANDPEYKCSDSRAIQFMVDFYLDKTTTLKNLELNAGNNKCSYNKWERSNNIIPSFDQRNNTPIRRLVLIENYNGKQLKLNIFLFIKDLKCASILPWFLTGINMNLRN